MLADGVFGAALSRQQVNQLGSDVKVHRGQAHHLLVNAAGAQRFAAHAIQFGDDVVLGNGGLGPVLGRENFADLEMDGQVGWRKLDAPVRLIHRRFQPAPGQIFLNQIHGFHDVLGAGDVEHFGQRGQHSAFLLGIQPLAGL